MQKQAIGAPGFDPFPEAKYLEQLLNDPLYREKHD
jgi:hypothetical protein